MRELLIKIRAILEGAGLKDAAQGQKDLAAATKEATRAAEQQARTTTTQATPADTAAAKAKDALAGASTKAASRIEELKRAGGPAAQIMQGLSQASAGGAQAISGLANVLRGSLAAALAPLGPGGAIAIGAAVVAGLVAAFLKTRKPAEDAAEGIKKVADAAKEIEQANLDKLSEGFARLNTQADEAKARLLASLDLSKQLADAETAAQIAFTKAQVTAGQISKEQGDEAIRGFGLAKQLRDTQDPAKRAAIEADFAAQSAEQQRAQEAAIEAKLTEALTLANFFESETKRLDALIASLEARQVGPRSAGPDAPPEVLAERQRLDDEIRKAQEDRAKVEANQAAQQARLQPINDELIKAVEARAEAERKAAAAAEQAAAVQATADQVGALQTGTAQAEQTAGRVGNQPPGVAGPGGGKPDFSLAGIRRGRIPAADGGTILVGGKPYVPADVPETPLRDAPATPLRDSPAGTIEVRDAQGNLVDAVKQGAKQGVAEGLSEIPRRARGGDVKKGEPQVVGDGGQSELFVPPEDGTILPEVDDGIISDSREAGSGDRAPQQASRPKGISSSAEAAADNAIESAIWAAQHGGKGFDGSDRANAASVRSFREREPERWAQMMSDGFARLEQANQANHAATMEQSRLMTHYLQEIYFQGKKLGIA
jgi:hypothetical protein